MANAQAAFYPERYRCILRRPRMLHSLLQTRPVVETRGRLSRYLSTVTVWMVLPVNNIGRCMYIRLTYSNIIFFAAPSPTLSSAP
ncbi:hypothetical protein B0H34DRAFT_811682 [Crassisporium funariophilum]|nr:hypothetical protein B0H34DRAFT_811682 [Crassisporium funariophilum]